METRRSKRLLFKECTNETNESPKQVKKIKSNFPDGKKNSKSCPKISVQNKKSKKEVPYEQSDDDSDEYFKLDNKQKSIYFDSSLKSSKFKKSPKVSKFFTQKSETKKINENLKQKIKLSSESDSDNEKSDSIKEYGRKFKKNDTITVPSSTIRDHSNTNPKKEYKRSFESESDSSSDEFVKAPKSLLELGDKKYRLNQGPSHSSNVDSVINANDDLTEENNSPCEYFDFTQLLSQVNKSDNTLETSTEDIKENIKFEKDERNSNKKNKRMKKCATSAKKSVKNTSDNVEQMEVFELLAKGENTNLSAKDIRKSIAHSSEETYEIPKQVEVLMDTPVMKKKKCTDLETMLKRRLNSVTREKQVYIHKVHLLCFIAHGNYINSVLNSPELLSVALSLLPSDKCYPPKRMNMEYLESLIAWFKKITLKKDTKKNLDTELSVSLVSQFQKLEAETKTDLCFMFLCIIRALGVKCRLIINLNVLPTKPSNDQLLPLNQAKEEKYDKTNVIDRIKKIDDKKGTCDTKKSEKPSKIDNHQKRVNLDSKNKSKNEARKTNENNKSKKDKITKKDWHKNEENDKSPTSCKSVNKNDQSKYSESKKKQSEYFKEEQNTSRRSSRLSKSKSVHFESKKSMRSNTVSSKMKSKGLKKNKIENETESEFSVEEMSTSNDSDSSFDNTFVFSKKIKKIDRKVLSSEEETINSNNSEVKVTKQKNNYWIEAYLEAEEKWMSVDIAKNNYHCDQQLYNGASRPVRYILAWNNDQTIKDVTRRYVPQYLTLTRKLRVDENWWKSTLYPFKPSVTPQEKEEDEELDKMLEEQPLPSSISEYKNHPLYALERHLLKFQAIYPPDAPTLGFIRGEPVYSRLCVQQLHGREMWIKEAKVVRIGEKPYKIVKGRQKKDKFGSNEAPRDLELFGSWQVEDYDPPTADNGIVPRNAFGNVELFKPCMLPKGTVYLQIPGLQRVANKLNIDCAAAIVGFEYSTNGWSYPVKDGFVVCEEFKDILLDAFNQELEEAEKKEKQKREERVYGNWRRLIKALYIREKLKRKYNFSLSDQEVKKNQKK